MSVGLRVASVCLLAFGLLFGWTPMTAAGVSCGSVLGGASAQARFGLIGPACADKRSARLPLVWGALVVGGILGVAGYATRPQKPSNKVPWN